MLDTTLINVKKVEETPFYGKFEIEPLDRGYGQTLGNALRRVLLSSLPGAAVTFVKVGDAKHEYATVNGVEEDVMNIILNLKGLKLKMHGDEKEILTISAKKAGEITAADINTTSNVEILNPELHIATLSDSKSPFTMELTVEKGTGYNSNEVDRTELGLIPVDADFSPVERVNFSVTSARLGQVTDLDKLTVEVFTKSITPSEAMSEALDTIEKVVTSVKTKMTEAE